MRNRVIAVLMLLIAAIFAPAQYQQALPGYSYQFPRDHFNHPDYRTEWWYYTGNLTATDGHRFGFELTFFRQGVNRQAAASSDWDVRDVYLAHLALSDLDGGRFYHTERLNRAGPGLAGSSLQQQRVWNGNWQVQWANGQQDLQAITGDFSLRLSMTSHKHAGNPRQERQQPERRRRRQRLALHFLHAPADQRRCRAQGQNVYRQRHLVDGPRILQQRPR
jgi:predicted secreted hydrolase